MATIRDLRTWMVRDLLRPNIQIHNPRGTQVAITGPVDNGIGVVPIEADEPGIFRASFFTATNQYRIYAVERPHGKSYMGCTSLSRRARPGEDWQRGNDLPDGPLTEETWQAILAGVVRYEAQRISPDCRDNE